MREALAADPPQFLEPVASCRQPPSTRDAEAMQRDENEFRIRIGRSASDVRPALKQVRAGVRRASASKPKCGSPIGQSAVRAHFA